MTKPKENLDFIVIGAPKAGTTPLFKIIKDHPQISIPPGKEMSFFSDDKIYRKGFSWYYRQINKCRKPDSLLGTVTPQYMQGQGEVLPAEIAKRIKKNCPDTKLVAVLRNPLDRTFSHYKMVRRLGYEKRSFEEAIRHSIANKDSFKSISRTNQPLMASLYGEVLQSYYKFFKKSQIHIIFTEELKNNPEVELEKLFNFLAIDSKFKPPKSQETIHKGGFEPRMKFLTPKFLYSIPMLKYAWLNLVPYSIRKRVDQKINNWNIKPDSSRLEKDSEIRRYLTNYFKKDVKLLEVQTNKRVSWNDFKTK